MKCSKCNGTLSNRYIIRKNKKLCGRHFLNEGLRKGDKVKVVGQNEVITATDNKIKNFQILSKGAPINILKYV